MVGKMRGGVSGTQKIFVNTTRSLKAGARRDLVSLYCGLRFALYKDLFNKKFLLSNRDRQNTQYFPIIIPGSAVSGVLVKEDRGEQKPVFYVSKTLEGSELRYPTIEKIAFAVVISARKLRPYFQSHAIVVLTNQPLRQILHSPGQSGRLAKWAVELSEYDIEYHSRTTNKSQVLADFLVELPSDTWNKCKSERWTLHVDGASSQHGSGIGIRLTSPTGEILEQSFRLAFSASNNEAEYEALIAGLRLAIKLKVKDLQTLCDSQLVVQQYNGQYEAKNQRMNAYLRLVKILTDRFDSFSLEKIPRSANAPADALAILASTSDPDLRREIPVESIDVPSISEKSLECFAIQESFQDNAHPSDGARPDWRTEILDYIRNGTVPADKWEARRLKAKAAMYVILDNRLYKRSATGTLLSCLTKDEAELAMYNTHDGGGGNHSGGKALALKIRRHGQYWPNMDKDCEKFVAKCEPCQRHAHIITNPTELLQTATAPYPFMRWAMDIVGPLPRSHQKRYILVMTDYFTKWVEAEAYVKVEAEHVRQFVWKNIICRHGLPYEIVTDNGSQFTSNLFEGFCAKWGIRLNKSTPRHPQGNGQAEATNKTIVDGLRKRLTEKKGLWADELDGVLWSHRTTPRQATNQTPFSLAHGVEAMSPAEAAVGSLRLTFMVQDPALNYSTMCDRLDTLEERRDNALLRIQNYQQATSQYYNKSVKSRGFEEGDFVLRKVYENTEEENAGKLGAKWEGPYQISRIVKPGVYELLTEKGELVPRSWNSLNLKLYHSD